MRKTLNPVQGAVYVITDPDGNTVEVTTDAEGSCCFSTVDEKYAGKEFKIKRENCSRRLRIRRNRIHSNS